MKKTKLLVLLFVVALMAVLSSCGAAPGKESAGTKDSVPSAPTKTDSSAWPSKPITLIVANKAGSSTDIMCRLLADGLSKELGQTVVVENKEGSSGWNAWNYLLHNAPKDGYTFASINLNIVFGQYDENNPREDGLDDFELLANQVGDISGFAIQPDETRFSTLSEMIEYSKTTPLYTAAQATGITNGDSATLEWFKKNYGCQFEIVPVDSTSDSVAMFKGGNIDFLIGSVSNFAADTKNGELNTISLFSEERSTMMPDVPTAKEQGYDCVSFSARGYAYPKGVDAEIVGKMQTAMEAVISDSEVQNQLADMGQETLMLVGGEYTDVLEAELNKRLEIFGVEKK